MCWTQVIALLLHMKRSKLKTFESEFIIRIFRLNWKGNKHTFTDEFNSKYCIYFIVHDSNV